MITEDSVYRIGTVTRTHGVKGEVSVSFTDDVWDRTDTDYLILRIDGILVPFFMEEYRFRSDTTALVKFVGYDSVGDAQELCGTEVLFPHELAAAPADGDEYTWRYFTGFRVKDVEAGDLGRIDSVDDRTQNVLLHVGDIMIPAAEEFIRDIDHKARVLTMSLPQGLLNL